MLGFGDPREDHSFGEQWLAFAGFHYHAVDEDSAWDNVVEVDLGRWKPERFKDS